MMKQKHYSVVALLAVVAIMSMTLVAFASSAPESSGVNPTGQGAPEIPPILTRSQGAEWEASILARGGEDGERQYSMDNGKTWLSEEDYRAQLGGSDWQVEWWTAEGYATWLEQEKVELQSIIGERGYTGGEGWFTWDQQRVDEAIALYESILENIKNGALYSKRITDKNGGMVEEVALGSGTMGAAELYSFDEKDTAVPAAVDEDALLEELKAFGVGGAAGSLTYNGKLILHLVDGAPAGDSGYSIRYVYTNPEGMVDVHTLRSVIRHPDGSYDTMGELIGVAEKEDSNFDRRLIESAASSGGAQETIAEGTDGEGGTSFEEIFARYQPYGLSYAPRESGLGGLTWNDQAVKSFADLKPDGGTFTYQDPSVKRGLRLYTVYDENGRLADLRGE